jgi:hypothetical protein
MVIKKLYSSDSRRRTISKLNSNFVAITPDVILEISDKTPTENMESIIWIDTSMDDIIKEINTKTYADEYFASHPDIDRSTFKYIGEDGKPTLEFKKMLYGDDYDPSHRYILRPKNNTMVDFCKPIETQNGIKEYNLNSVVFDTKNLNTLYNAFNNANQLKFIDTSSWNTGKVTNMQSAFNNCQKLQSIGVSRWDTSSTIDMSYMFYNCKSLVSLDISTWDTSKVTGMPGMFTNCSSLTTINGIIDFKSCTSYYAIFQNCPNLTSVKVKNIPTGIDTFCSIAYIPKSKVIVVQ